MDPFINGISCLHNNGCRKRYVWILINILYIYINGILINGINNGSLPNVAEQRHQSGPIKLVDVLLGNAEQKSG